MNEFDKLNQILNEHPPYRLRQVNRVIFRELVDSWEKATNLPKGLRKILERDWPLTINSKTVSADKGKTVKAVISFSDGVSVETVLMRHRDGRNTVCVSSQAGCPIGCDYCLTGKQGYTRQLSMGEIVEQVLFFARLLKLEGERIRNVVFMGMGEPFLNYAAVMEAIRLINDPEGLKIGARRISISTIGIVKGIEMLAREPMQINLAVSLHAVNDNLRTRLIPENKRHPIRDVLSAVARYIDSTRRKVMIEYLLLDGINDSTADAEKLAVLLKNSLGHLYYVNLIAYNPTGKYRASAHERVEEFRQILNNAGITVTRRYRFGREIKAACGQLASG